MNKAVLSRRDFLKFSSMTVAGSALLAACSPAGSPGGGGGAAQENVELIHTFWGSPEEMQLWTSFDEQFTENNEGVTMVSEHIASDYDNQILLRQAANDLPDVLNIQDEPLPKFADKNTYANLDAFMDRDSAELALDDFFPNTVDMFKYNQENKMWLEGSQWAMPWDGGEILWYYNKGVFEDAGVEPPANNGWDWDMNDFLELSHQLTKTDGDGKLERAAFLLPGWVYHMPFIMTMGGSYYDLENGKGMTNTPESIEAIQFYMDLRHKERVVPQATEFTDMNSTELFRQGKIGMHITGPWWFPDLRAIPEDELQWDVLHVPKNPATGERATRQSWDGMAVGAGSSNLDTSWDYIKFVLSTEGQTQISLLGRAMPARPSVANTDAFINPDAQPSNEEVFIEGTEYAVVQPITLYWDEAWTVLGKYWEQMSLEDVQMPVEEATVKIDEALDYLFANGELPAEY